MINQEKRINSTHGVQSKVGNWFKDVWLISPRGVVQKFLSQAVYFLASLLEDQYSRQAKATITVVKVIFYLASLLEEQYLRQA